MTLIHSEAGFRLIPISRSGRPDDHCLLLGPDLAAMCDDTRKLYDSFGHEPPWISYLSEADGIIIGGGAFVGRPVDGKVEIAYFTLPDFENRGLATRTVAALIRVAYETDPDVVLTAKTMPGHGPSTRILLSHQFRRVGMVEDHEIGEAWYWEKCVDRTR